MEAEALIAHRLKRLPSVRRKLQQSTVRLSQMQDVGGCRAILADIAHVDRLLSVYAAGREKAELQSAKNYIEEPKADGYRSAHLVYKYRSQSSQGRPYDGFKIEIQIRSRLQHAWATAVETVEIFADKSLRGSSGDPAWKRFFALTSSVIALKEHKPLVPATSTDLASLSKELRELSQELKALTQLTYWSIPFVSLPGKNNRNYDSFLLAFDRQKQSLDISAFSRSESEQERASQHYLESEKMAFDRVGAQVVLVSVETIDKLHRAYPNYWADTNAFVEIVKEATGEQFP